MLRRNKGERHESSDIRITKLAQVKEISEAPPPATKMNAAAEGDSLRNEASASCDEIPTSLDSACVTSTPMNGAEKPVNTDKPCDNKKTPRKDLKLEFTQSLVPRTRNDSSHHPPKSKQSWLLRLFESKLFDMSLAVTYLFNSKEQGVQVYIGE